MTPIPLADAFRESVHTFKQCLGRAPRDGRWSHGHDQASGGHLPHSVFAHVLSALGFADDTDSLP